MIAAMISIPILVTITLVLVHRLVDQGTKHNLTLLKQKEDIQQLVANLKIKQDKLAKICKQNVEIIYIREQLEKDLDTAQTLAKTYIDELDKANHTIADHEKTIADQKQTLIDYEAKEVQLCEQIKRRDEQASKQTKNAFNLECKADINEKKADSLKQINAALQADVTKCDDEIAELKARIKNRQRLFDKQHQKLTDTTEYAEALKEENRTLRAALDNANDKLDAIVHNADWKLRHKWLWDFAISYMRRLHTPELRITEFSEKVRAQQFGELTILPAPEPDKIDLIEKVLNA